MSRDNPRRRSWQRKPPLSPDEETAKHTRKTRRPKPYGIEITQESLWTGGRPWVYTRWYEREQDRAHALRDLELKPPSNLISTKLVERS